MLGRGVQAGVVQRYRSQLGESPQQHHVLVSEHPVFIDVAQAEDAHDLRPGPERHTRHGVESGAAELRRVTLPSGVILNHERLAALVNFPRQALPGAQPVAGVFLVNSQAHPHLQLRLSWLEKVDVTMRGAHQRSGTRDDGFQQICQLQPVHQGQGRFV